MLIVVAKLLLVPSLVQLLSPVDSLERDHVVAPSARELTLSSPVSLRTDSPARCSWSTIAGSCS